MPSLLGLVILILDIFAIVEIVKSSLTDGKKALWVILIVLLPVVGLILYYFLGRKKV